MEDNLNTFKIRLQLFSEKRGLQLLQNPECLFGLDEEIDRRLPCVRSLHLTREERYGG